jgi:Periplasmic binding protein domain
MSMEAPIENNLRVTNDPMEATWIGFKMWSAAVAEAGTTEVDKVREAMKGLKKAPSGVEVTLLGTTAHACPGIGRFPMRLQRERGRDTWRDIFCLPAWR